MKFIKYPKLTNHYAVAKDKTLMSYLDSEFYETEKLHGANVSIIFNKDLEHVVASRNQILVKDSDVKQFSGAFTFVRNNIELLREVVTSYFNDKDDVEQVHLFGEFYGKGVQHMDYEEVKNGVTTVRFFNVFLLMEDGRFIKTNHRLLTARFPKDMIVPSRGYGILKDLLSRSDSHISKSELGGYSEGSAYQFVDEYEVDGNFIGIKHKTEEFAEKKKTPRPKVALSAEELAFVTEIKTRVTRQRVLNVLSHGGLVVEPKHYGMIIKAVQVDILEESLRESPNLEEDVVKKHLGKIGGDVVAILKEM